MTGTRYWTWLAVAALCACASEPPAASEGFDASAGRVTVTLGEGAFVRFDGERMPFDAMVLRLRLRARAMSADELQRFVVRVEVAPDLPEAAADHVEAARARLMQQLHVMDVAQVEVR